MNQYTWTINGGTITAGGGSNDNTVTVTWGPPPALPLTDTGTVTVTYFDPNGNCVGFGTTTIKIRVNPLPSVAPIGGGAASVCVGGTTPTFTDATSGGTWSTSDATIATIDVTGIVSGIAAGPVNIIYSFTDAKGCTNTAITLLTVYDYPIVAAIGGGAATVCVGSNTPAFTDATAGGVWSITAGTGTASIDNLSGIATGLTGGTVTVVYTVTNAGGCVTTVSTPLTVNSLPAAGAIAGGAATVCVGSTTPAFTDGIAGGTWSTSDLTIATIDVNGIATGVAPGLVQVIYTVTISGCTNTATTPLTVTALPSVAAIGGGAATVCIGSTTPAFTNATAGGVWSITDGTGDASVDINGIVTGNLAGTVSVVYTVTSGGCTNTATALLTVNALPPVAAIQGGLANVCVGSNTLPFTDATPGGTWSIIPGTGTASIDNLTGIVTGLTAGTVTVVYTITSGGCTNTATAPLTVSGTMPAISPIGGGAAAICIGATTTFTDATGGGTWSIINGFPGTASIDAGGVVTGLSAGPVTVVYTTSNGTCTSVATTLLTIEQLPTPIGGGAANVCVGLTTPSFTNGTSGGAWFIAAGTGTASIDAGGVVTGLTAGTVTVVYAVNNSCGPHVATVPLTINSLPVVASIGGGAPAVCAGLTTPAFTDATAGGTWSITNGTGTAIIDNLTGIATGLTAGTVTVVYTYSNGTCSNTATTALTIHDLPAPTISPTAACEFSSGNVYTTQAGMSNYLWTVTGNVSHTGGGPTDNFVNVDWGAAGTGTITVNYTNANGCTAASASSQNITINPLPTPTISPTSAVCPIQLLPIQHNPVQE